MLICFATLAQQKFNWQSNDVFKTSYFIQNIGQYKNISNEDILFGVDNCNDKIFVTNKGLKIQIAKVSSDLAAVKDNLENETDELIREKQKLTKTYLSLHWLNYNANFEVKYGIKSNHYFSFGDMDKSANGFETVVLKNLYNHIDVEYSLPKKGGIKYTIILNPGANINDLKFTYNLSVGELKISLNNNNVVLQNAVENFIESDLKAYNQQHQEIKFHYSIHDNVLSLLPDEKLNVNETTIIDPWIHPVTTLTGDSLATDKAFDVDYDVTGNLYVYGGGGLKNYPKVAKYSSNGNLLWTFMGQVTSKNWASAPNENGYNYIGNFSVNRVSEKTYIGQGYNDEGATIIRLNKNGFYDNFITVSDSSFREVWDMQFNCNNGNIIALGGSTTSNFNFAVIDSSSGSLSTLKNVTGISTNQQDVVSSSLSETGECYLLFNSFITPEVDNDIFKIDNQFNTVKWTTPTGFSSFDEPDNKPYVLPFIGNSFNALANNSQYLFYYDGKYLKAFDATNSNAIATLSINNHVIKMQGGIAVSDCNDIFIGSNNGNVLKIHFDGAKFTFINDLKSFNYLGKSVYDIVLNPFNNLLYVSGDGFVEVLNSEINCNTSKSISVQIFNSCQGDATANILLPNIFSGYRFIWKDAETDLVLKDNAFPSGVIKDNISNLKNNHFYSLTVVQNSPCKIKARTFLFNTSYYFNQFSVTVCNSDPYILPNKQMVYKSGIFTGTIKNKLGNGCDTIFEASIFHNDKCECQYFMPNSFTPNADGLNDVIRPIFNCVIGENYQFHIYNRWGQKIFTALNIDDAWDGTFKGKPQEVGVYIYYIEYKNPATQVVLKYKGDITLMH